MINVQLSLSIMITKAQLIQEIKSKLPKVTKTTTPNHGIEITQQGKKLFLPFTQQLKRSTSKLR